MKRVACSCSLVLGLSYGLPALGANGLNLIGVSAESIGMGGADLAVARDPLALNSNPAGLTRARVQRLDLAASGAYALDIRHRDNLGNDTEISNNYVSAGSFGYTAPLSERGVTWGIGFYAQGGAGYEYENLYTTLGTRDNFTSQLGIARLSAGAALEVNPQLSVGASIAASYARLERRILPNTSVFTGNPATSFFGYTIDDANGIGYGAKFGLQYRPSPNQTWGIAYTSPTRIELNGEDLRSNQGALGLGVVRYNDVKIKGLGLPQEIGIGYARQQTPRLLWTMELNWLDWSAAMKTMTLYASEPANPLSPALTGTSANYWRDQYVLAIGLLYTPNDRTTWRAGYNYGRNPIPDENLSPLLAAITEQHLTFGFGLRLDDHWRTDVGVQYNIPNSVTYTNTALPFGPNAQETNELVLVQLLLSRTW